MVWHAQVIGNEPLKSEDLARCSTMRKCLIIAVELKTDSNFEPCPHGLKEHKV